MSQITIQCRLVASEPTRKLLWELMAEKNTPLINEMLWKINHHSNFEQWQSDGKLPGTLVSDLCKSLKLDPLYAGQPSRFYLSVTKLVNYIYKSWLKLQQHRQRQLEGQIYWLSMLKSDTELLKESECSLDILRKRANAILSSIEAEIGKSQADKKPKRSKLLFDLYDQSEDTSTRSAICYLLKNGSKLPKPDKPEDGKKFARRRRKVAIKIERLYQQLEGSRPHGRDLTDEQWLNSLQFVATPDIVNSKYIYKTFCILKDPHKSLELVAIVILLAQKYIAIEKSWQAIFLTKPKFLPFPITFETNEDLKWHKNETGRLCVRFNGLSEHIFQIYCDHRQLHWFKRFLEDQQFNSEQ